MFRFGFFFAVVCVLLADASYKDQPLYQTVIPSKPMKSLYFYGSVHVYLVEASSPDACRIEARGSFDDKSFTVLHSEQNNSESMIHIRVEPLASPRVETIVVYHNNELSALAIAANATVETIGRGIVKADDEPVRLFSEQGKNLTMKLDVSEVQALFNGVDSVRLTGTIRGAAMFSVKNTSSFDAADLTIKTVQMETEFVGLMRINAIDDLKMRVDPFSKVYYRLPNGTEPSDIQAEPGAEIRRIF